MNKEKPVYVFDSFALLTYLGGESGADRVASILRGAGNGEVRVDMSMINLGEVLYIVERHRGLTLAQQTLAAVGQLPVHLLEATRDRIWAAAHIKANARLSYADAFAAAAAQEMAGTILTGDPEFAAVENMVAVEWL